MSQDTTSPEQRIAARQQAILLELAQGATAAVMRGEPLDVWISSSFRAHPGFGSRDRRFYGDALFALFRWRGALDTAAIEDPLTRLRVAWALDGRPAPPPLAMGAPIEHEIARARATPSASWVPAWVPAQLVDPARADGFIRSLQVRPPTWLRCKAGRYDDVSTACERRGAVVTAHPRLPNALAIDRPLPLQELHRETGAAFEVQDLASQAVGAVADPQPGQSWWDVCAGAGGKTLDLADRMGANGFLCASDARPAALQELVRRARAAGVTSLRPDDGVRPFDGVLVDAPCSGLGTWSRNPDMRWRTDESAIKARAMDQRSLLDEVAGRVRPGGSIVYSVCTMTRAETVDLLRDFLGAHPDFKPEPFTHPLRSGAVDGSIQIWPDEGPCGGMYIARMVRAGRQD